LRYDLIAEITCLVNVRRYQYNCNNIDNITLEDHQP
jgi:hypothetical protein